MSSNYAKVNRSPFTGSGRISSVSTTGKKVPDGLAWFVYATSVVPEGYGAARIPRPQTESDTGREPWALLLLRTHRQVLTSQTRPTYRDSERAGDEAPRTTTSRIQSAVRAKVMELEGVKRQ